MPGAKPLDSYAPLEPRRAVVVPRARRPNCSARLPIDQLILPILRTHRHGIVHLIAPPGGGKTTALCHLRAVASPDLRAGFFDEPRYQHGRDAAREVRVVVPSRQPPPDDEPRLGVFELAEWTADDCLEYVAATHRDRCSSVLKRLLNDASLGSLN